MTATENQHSRPETGTRNADLSRGNVVDRVSSEWCMRPDDEKYLSLSALYASAKRRAEYSSSRTLNTSAIHVETHGKGDSGHLGLTLHVGGVPLEPTHWSFDQLANLVGAPADYLRKLPMSLAANNLQFGLTSQRAKPIKTLESSDDRAVLRAVTGISYGRIYDHKLVSAVQKIAGDGIGDTRWKVPGTIDWSCGTYNPDVDITKDTTTLYASDRDVFMFLVDDKNPIEAGKLQDGSPDLFFRGFYCWNSEVGSKSLGIASFYLRAVCQNHMLYGVEDFQEIRIRHTQNAADRFAKEVEPALIQFAESSPKPFIEGVRAARERIVAQNDKDRADFLKQNGFNKTISRKILETVVAEEDRAAETVFDFVQGLTALARSEPHQDARIALEGTAKILMDLAA